MIVTYHLSYLGPAETRRQVHVTLSNEACSELISVTRAEEEPNFLRTKAKCHIYPRALRG